MKKEYMKPTTIVVKRKVKHYVMTGSPIEIKSRSTPYEEGMEDL